MACRKYLYDYYTLGSTGIAVLQSKYRSHGIWYVYPPVDMIFSHQIPDLFTPGIFTPSCCGKVQIAAKSEAESLGAKKETSRLRYSIGTEILNLLPH